MTNLHDYGHIMKNTELDQIFQYDYWSGILKI